jgi:hypothetical protein
MDSSHELATIYTMNFVIYLYLIFLIGVQMTGLKFVLINPTDPKYLTDPGVPDCIGAPS